jgi:hypothetical protein
MGEMRYALKILVGKPDRKRQLGRPRHGWEDDIRTHLREIGWESVGGIHLAQNRGQWRAFVNNVMSLRVL